MRLWSLSVLQLASNAASAQPAPPDLADMVGARAGQAENELGRRGYRFIRADQGDDRSYTHWWNAGRRQCVTIATMEGRYSSITASPAPDCRQSSSLQPTPGYAPPPPRPPAKGDYDPGYSQNPVMVGGQGVQLALVCYGDGTKAGVRTDSGWRWNDRKEQYERDYRRESTTERFDAALTLQLWDGGGRIRLPKSLIPPLNSRGANGWWELRDVAASPDRIRASYRLNGLNQPRSPSIGEPGKSPYKAPPTTAFAAPATRLGESSGGSNKGCSLRSRMFATPRKKT